MSWFRKHLFPVTTIVFLVFSSVLIAETSHHHGNWESKDDCSVCSWQQTGAQGTITVHPTLLFGTTLLVLLFIFTPSYFSLFSLSIPGRSPPANLL